MSTAAAPRLATNSVVPTLRPAWALLASDVVALEASFALGLALRRLLGAWLTAEIGPTQYLGVAAGLLVLPLVYYQLSLYPGYLLSPVERLRRRTLATMALFGALVAWDNLVARGVFSRGVLLATLAFALVLPPLAEAITQSALVRSGSWGMPVVIFGCGESGQAMARASLREPRAGLRPIAFLDNRPEVWNTIVDGVPVVGPLNLAPDFERRAQAAIVALEDLGPQDARALLQELNFPRVIVVPDLGGVANLWVSARSVGGYLGLEIRKNLLLRRNHVLKSAMDWLLALPLFLLSLPVIAVAGIWIKLSSRGPVFYRQTREGLNGQRVPIWKLRTMYVDNQRLLEEWLQSHPEDRDHWNRYFKLRHDPRVLPVIGRLLRKTSLDELPQLWSILTGEMSLVGPRPLPEYHLNQFTAEFRTLRAKVLPGLTGLWQVSARSDGDLHVLQELDTFYIRNWSPWLDLHILARTVKVVLRGDGAY